MQINKKPPETFPNKQQDLIGKSETYLRPSKLSMIDLFFESSF